MEPVGPEHPRRLGRDTTGCARHRRVTGAHRRAARRSSAVDRNPSTPRSGWGKAGKRPIGGTDASTTRGRASTCANIGDQLPADHASTRRARGGKHIVDSKREHDEVNGSPRECRGPVASVPRARLRQSSRPHANAPSGPCARRGRRRSARSAPARDRARHNPRPWTRQSPAAAEEHRRPGSSRPSAPAPLGDAAGAPVHGGPAATGSATAAWPESVAVRTVVLPMLVLDFSNAGWY